MTMTPDAKRELSKTIKGLRAHLLGDRDASTEAEQRGALHAATDGLYRLSVRTQDAGLREAELTRRRRLEAWISEQVRAEEAAGRKGKSRRKETDFLREAQQQAAYTLVNRLVILRLMEADGVGERGEKFEPLRSPPVVTGGWGSRGYQDFRQLAPTLARPSGDETEGYAFLLELMFQDLATEMPGLFGSAGVADLIPVPPATLRRVVEQLDDPELDTCWTDDMTLGWVYQYWNDPERKRLDDKLEGKLEGSTKLETHEIASKTQLFTERYMVDWLLQNSLGPMWLAMCRRHGWTSDVEAPGPDGKSVLDRLDERRVDWRAKRDCGEVSLTDLMPLHTAPERRWAYFVPQPIPDDAVEQAPESVRGLRILDPAVGSGHFLVVAMDLLVELYREEARHRGAGNTGPWSDGSIVESILESNLHGIDLDPRAVQIAAAALWLKGRRLAPDARPARLQLVASNLRLAALAHDDPALVELRNEVERETGVPGKLMDRIVEALHGADHLGSLLKIDQAVASALEEYEQSLEYRRGERQREIWDDDAPVPTTLAFDADAAQSSVLARLESFLAQHSRGDDLGLRLRGEQLAAGVRFVRMVREESYDLVVANPPYQGTSSLADSTYVQSHYPLGKADLYAAFLLRGLELVRKGGVSAMLTMRNWMFIKQYSDLRAHLLATFALNGLLDLDTGAFSEISPAKVVTSVAIVVLRRGDVMTTSPVQRAFLPETTRQQGEFDRKRAATLCQVGTYAFQPKALQVVPEWPLVYWWGQPELDEYRDGRLLGDSAPVRNGLSTQDNTRFLRLWWEPSHRDIDRGPEFGGSRPARGWAYYVKGAEGRVWIEDARDVVRWDRFGLEVKTSNEFSYGSYTRSVKNEGLYFQRGVAFSLIGSGFSARVHRWPSVFGHMGASVFASDSEMDNVLCLLNSSHARRLLGSLNPGVHFLVGDVNRLPLRSVPESGAVVEKLVVAFDAHEAHRESSVEFRAPGPSSWRYAQEWAQVAVDRPQRPTPAPLAPYQEELDPEPATDHLSFAVGVALGRFDANGAGVLDPSTDDISTALPAGILFLDGGLDDGVFSDSLGHPAAACLHDAWERYRPLVATKRSGLRSWLALDFFEDVHRKMYESRPIHWPLSSAQKTFVAWINIHRWNQDTLRVLLADHLEHGSLKRLEGELSDLSKARGSDDKRAASKAEDRYSVVQRQLEELRAFIALIQQCADRGAPPTDAKCPAREQDARYAPNLDDGVMINSAALWPLLEPQWKDPKKWWKELASAKGKKDYDWSHLALRYWPERVDGKCRKDPSLGVAHGCFWRYHPGRAWAWELRLQDEIGPDFRIEEPPYRPGGRALPDEGDGIDDGDAPHRARWLRDHASEALAAVEKEAARRMGTGKDKRLVSQMCILEPGLWSMLPDEVWEMELRLAKKQGSDFRLVAPDEPAARAQFEETDPVAVQRRRELLASLATKAGLFGDDVPESGTVPKRRKARRPKEGRR